MSRQHGKSTVILVAGSPITPHANTSTFKRTAKKHDLTVYGNDDELNESGLGAGEFTVGGFYDNSMTTGPRAIIEPLVGGPNVTIIRRLEGTGSGKPQQSFSATVDDYTETAPANDYVTWSATFTKSGPVDDTPQP